jgi:adenine deaminase
MTDSPITEVVGKLNEMILIARELGVYGDLDPFMTLSFLALPVIPEIKLTDRGLLDTKRFNFVRIGE